MLCRTTAFHSFDIIVVVYCSGFVTGHASSFDLIILILFIPDVICTNCIFSIGTNFGSLLYFLLCSCAVCLIGPMAVVPAH